MSGTTEQSVKPTHGRSGDVRTIGALLLLFVALLGLAIALDAGTVEVAAEYSIDVEPAVIAVADDILAEWVPARHRCVLRGRVTADYARPNDARLASARYDQCEPTSQCAIALAAESERLILPRSISPTANRRQGAVTGRFAGDLA